MDQETAKYLWALKEINKSLVVAIETALASMEKWEEFDPERPQGHYRNTATTYGPQQESV